MCGLVDPIGAAALFGAWQADVDVGAERFGDLGAQVLTDGATGDPAEHLAEDEAEGGHVIALRGARLPPRFGGGQPFAHQIPVGDLRPVHPLRGPITPDRWLITMAEGDVLLAGLGELGPVAGHRRIQVEFTALDELVDAGAGQALGAGEHGGQRVLPATGGCRPHRPMPPHRLTTSSPSTQAATAAPTSLPCTKFCANASRTPSKRVAHEPWMATSAVAPGC